MAQQVINIGTSPNDGTGDQLRTAFDKCNDNFTELYAGTGGGAVDSVNGQTGVVVLDATDVDALQRDGSNANSDIDIDTFSFNAKSLHTKGTAGTGHLGLKHQSSNATASASETSLFAGSDGELYYKNDGNAVEQVASETFVNTGLATKQNTLVSGTNIKRLEGLTALGAGDLEYINNLIFEQNINYALPIYGSTTYAQLRTSTSVTLQGGVGNFSLPQLIDFTSATPAGSLCFQRGTMGINNPYSSANKNYFKRRFSIQSNISGSRFVCGLSNQFGVAAPTNVEPDTLINTMGVCKLSTSNNLHIFYNDGTGLATTVDLGANYPANNVTAYIYDLEIYKESGTADLTIKLTRIDTSGNRISTSQTINTNYNTANQLSPIIFMSNNATLGAVRFFDYGMFIKTYNLQWNTI